MNAKDKEFYDIVLKNCTEKEIYAILLKKKEIDDKTPKLRTPDDNKMLKSFYYKMSKYSKDLIADIKKINGYITTTGCEISFQICNT